MSANKRYYWLKLNENFFEDDTIQWLEEQENGKDYVIFYLKLCLKSLQDDGQLIRYVGERLMPYDVKALAKLTSTSPDTVAVAMNSFEEIGLIEILDSGAIYMKQINEMIGTETDSARRVRKHRAKQIALDQVDNTDLLQSNVGVTKSNTEKEIEIEKELEKELEITTTTKEKKKKEEVVVEELPEALQMPNAEAYSKVSQLYQENIGVINPIVQQKINDWVDDLGEELVDYAIRIGATKNAYSWNYIESILKDWDTKNYKTIDDVKASVQQRKTKQQIQKGSSEPVPEWYGQKEPTSNIKFDEKDEGELKDLLAKLN